MKKIIIVAILIAVYAGVSANRDLPINKIQKTKSLNKSIDPGLFESKLLKASSIKALRSISTTEFNFIYLLGYSKPGDGGGGWFYWDPYSVDSDNGGTVIKIDKAEKGRYKRIFDEGSLNPKWFGAKGDSMSDDTPSLQKCINVASYLGTAVYIPPGLYNYTKLYICYDPVYNPNFYSGGLGARMIVKGAGKGDVWDEYRRDKTRGTVLNCTKTKGHGIVVGVDKKYSYTQVSYSMGTYFKDLQFRGAKEANYNLIHAEYFPRASGFENVNIYCKGKGTALFIKKAWITELKNMFIIGDFSKTNSNKNGVGIYFSDSPGGLVKLDNVTVSNFNIGIKYGNSVGEPLDQLTMINSQIQANNYGFIGNDIKGMTAINCYGESNYYYTFGFKNNSTRIKFIGGKYTAFDPRKYSDSKIIVLGVSKGSDYEKSYDNISFEKTHFISGKPMIRAYGGSSKISNIEFESCYFQKNSLVIEVDEDIKSKIATHQNNWDTTKDTARVFYKVRGRHHDIFNLSEKIKIGSSDTTKWAISKSSASYFPVYTMTPVPGSPSSIGTVGEMAWDSKYLYICIATNTWKRVEMSTW